MWAPIVAVAVVGLTVGVIAPAHAADDYVSITKLAVEGRTVSARIAFHEPTLELPGRDRLHVWLGIRQGDGVATLWRSTKVKPDQTGRHRLTVTLSGEKALALRTADRLLVTATQRHKAPGSELFATNYVASASVSPSGGKAIRGTCGERLIGPGADLSNCDLTGAVLRSGELRGTNLTGATLDQADLRGANLAGSTLNYNLSVDQAVNPKLDVQVGYGYLTSMSWTVDGQTTQLPLNLSLYDFSVRQSQWAVGALENVWVGPALAVTAAVKSTPELEALAKLPPGATVRFGLLVYRYDNATKAYFPAFFTGSAGLPGTLKSSPMWASAGYLGSPVDALLQFMVLPGPGCSAYSVRSAPGVGTAVRWGQDC